jgi:hypothetical protein
MNSKQLQGLMIEPFGRDVDAAADVLRLRTFSSFV